VTGHDVRALRIGARRAVVDGHPICATCGVAAVPIGRDRWRHLGPAEAYPYDSRWLRPAPVDEVLAVASYRDFGEPVTEADWHEGRRRLRDYADGLAAGRPLLDLVRILTGGSVPVGEMRVPAGVARVLDLDARRRELASRYAWAVPTESALGLIGDHGPILEVGAGTGYWAALLRERGVQVWATDAAPPDRGDNAYHRTDRAWSPVERMGAVRAVRAYGGTLLMCWPPPDDDTAGYAALRAYRGDVVLYAGGDAGGPTGTARLHRELELNWTVTDEVALPSWPGIPDRLTVWRRNPRRRALRERDRCPQCSRYIRTGATGRCDRCFAAAPPALAVRSGADRVEYPQAALDAMPFALLAALRSSPHRIC
jgi:hypothetical protein